MFHIRTYLCQGEHVPYIRRIHQSTDHFNSRLVNDKLRIMDHEMAKEMMVMVKRYVFHLEKEVDDQKADVVILREKLSQNQKQIRDLEVEQIRTGITMENALKDLNKCEEKKRNLKRKLEKYEEEWEDVDSVEDIFQPSLCEEENQESSPDQSATPAEETSKRVVTLKRSATNGKDHS